MTSINNNLNIATFSRLEAFFGLQDLVIEATADITNLNYGVNMVNSFNGTTIGAANTIRNIYAPMFFFKIFCHGSCMTCEGNDYDQCLSCDTTSSVSWLRGKECVCTSAINLYYATGSSVCTLNCHASCRTCKGPANTDCTTCGLGNQVLAGGACTCISYYYFNNSLNACDLCHRTCLTCNGPLSSNCLTCRPEYGGGSPVAGVCGCADRFFMSTVSGFCEPCYFTCKTCNGFANNNCLTCMSSAAPASGVCTCVDGFFENTTTRSCDPCHPSCRQCSGALSSNCISCILPGVTPSSGSCACPARYRVNSNPTGSFCEACH